MIYDVLFVICSHPSVMWWHWLLLILWASDLSLKLRSGSRWWSCSWSPAAGQWPARWLSTGRTVWERSGWRYRTVRTSCHRPSTSCSGGCRWHHPGLPCLWAGTTPMWRTSRSPWWWGSPVPTEGLREGRDTAWFLSIFILNRILNPSESGLIQPVGKLLQMNAGSLRGIHGAFRVTVSLQNALCGF